MRRLKKKTLVSNNLPVKIVFELYQSKIPLSLSTISNMCKSPRQKVSYHLVNLVSRGVLLYDNIDKTYRLQPALKDPCLIETLEPLITAIADKIDYSQVGQPLEEVITSILEYYLSLHVIE